MQGFQYTTTRLKEAEHWIVAHQAPSPACKVVEKASQTCSKFVLTPSRPAQECSSSLAIARDTLRLVQVLLFPPCKDKRVHAMLPALEAILGHRSAHSLATGPVIAEPGEERNKTAR